MKYDPLELMKLNISEESIQRQRDAILDALTTPKTPKVLIPIDKFWLPFIIDMLDDHKFTYRPGHCTFIEVEL